MTSPRRWSFPLRTLFVVMLLIAAGLAVLDSVRARRREQEALEQVEEWQRENKMVGEIFAHHTSRIGNFQDFLNERNLYSEFEDWRKAKEDEAATQADRPTP